jgi:hypothetical protein
MPVGYAEQQQTHLDTPCSPFCLYTLYWSGIQPRVRVPSGVGEDILGDTYN